MSDKPLISDAGGDAPPSLPPVGGVTRGPTVLTLGGGASRVPVCYVYAVPLYFAVMLVLWFAAGVPIMVSALVMLGLAGFFGCLMMFFGWICG